MSASRFTYQKSEPVRGERDHAPTMRSDRPASNCASTGFLARARAWKSKQHLLTLMIGAAMGCGGGGPRLRATSYILDFGVVPRDGKVVVIPISNAGTKVLRITRVSASCSCIVAGAVSDVSPGREVRLDVKLRGSAGPNSSRLVVESNDPAGAHEFSLRWFGECAPAFDPPGILLTKGIPGDSIVKDVKMTYPVGDLSAVKIESITYSKGPFELIERSDSTPAKIAVDAPSSPLPERAFQFRCKLPDKAGVVSGEIIVVASVSGKEYRLVLPVELHVVGPIDISGLILFSSENADELRGEKKAIQIRVKGDEGRLLIVDAPKWVRCTINEIKRESGKVHGFTYFRVAVEITKTPPRGISTHEIRVQVGGRKQEIVSIPVHLASTP